MESNTFVDIIIPVFNTKKENLLQCLNSIYKQTYKKFHIIIIDDGSNDETRSYLDKIADTNPNIILYHCSKIGVSRARNYGIEKGTSPYVAFVDSDDIIYNSFLEESLGYAIQYNADVVIGGLEFSTPLHSCFYHAKSNNLIPYIYNDSTKDNLIRQLLSGVTPQESPELYNCANASPGAKLYRRSVIENIFFPTEIAIYEDLIFNVEVLRKCSRICLSELIWYKYIQHSDSSIHSTNNNLPISFRNAMDYAAKLLKTNKEYGADIYKFKVNYLRTLLDHYVIRSNNNLGHKQRISILNQCINTWAYSYITKNGDKNLLTRGEKIFDCLANKHFYFALYELFRVKDALKNNDSEITN